MKALAGRRAGDLPCSAEAIVLDVGDCLGPAYNRMIAQHAGCILITRERRLAGVGTRSDLIAALARGANRDTPLGEVMNARPVSIGAMESAAMAAEKMADAGLKYLPVTDAEGTPVRLLTADDFVGFALALPRQA
jgi:CBS domain-containing protein